MIRELATQPTGRPVLPNGGLTPVSITDGPPDRTHNPSMPLTPCEPTARGSKNPPLMITFETNSPEVRASGTGAVCFRSKALGVKSVLLKVPSFTALPGEHSG